MNKDINVENSNSNFKNIFLRYFSFWPVFLISVLFFVIFAYLYLRYTSNIYLTNAKIEIIDDAMDSEMALPTEMTIFNRSTINLENEIEIIKSYRIIKNVVEKLKSNVIYYTQGRILLSENHKSEWLNGIDYELQFNRPTDSINEMSSYIINFSNSETKITHLDRNSNEIKTHKFKGYDTSIYPHDMIFNLIINKPDDIKDIVGYEYRLDFMPVGKTVNKFRKKVKAMQIGKLSDLLNITLTHTNPKVAEDFLLTLTNQFNQDGVTDRQLVFKRTIDFVDSRFKFLKDELNIIEEKKQLFKADNNLSYLESDAQTSNTQKLFYENDLFKYNSQLELLNFLLSSIDSENIDYIPINIGIENSSINTLTINYNNLISNYNNLLNSAGTNNLKVKALEGEILNLGDNVIQSINVYKKSLNSTIKNLTDIGGQYSEQFAELPENEKRLREIEREQEIKEALFLLLYQKREEASINFAVTKPSIKIIDFPLTDFTPIFPNRLNVMSAAVLVGLLLPFLFFYLFFLFDTKIHTKEQLIRLLPNSSIVAEIPFIKDLDIVKNILDGKSRIPIVESFRILIANLGFLLKDINIKNNDINTKKAQVILVTSTIKGEGKTFISTNISSLFAAGKKVILIGADLRNPQIHKLIGKEKIRKGLSDYLYSDETEISKFLIKEEVNNFDILLSGTIPPNPTELLSSIKFDNLIKDLKDNYDYIIIDSAPCLLVADTIKIADLCDLIVYVVKSNFTDSRLTDFIKERFIDNKENNFHIVLNSVGNSSSYGYKYGYQYGYQYGYKYGYNYGYGYGYGSEND